MVIVIAAVTSAALFVTLLCAPYFFIGDVGTACSSSPPWRPGST
ncbi:hypothetical protein [Nocardia sp. NBC_00511]